MPIYCYKCKDCDAEFEARHRMQESISKCRACQSENIFKVPSIQQTKSVNTGSSKPGRIVDQYIVDTKREIQLEKERIRKEEL